MKKTLLLLFVFILSLSLAGCGSDNSKTSVNQRPSTNRNNNATSSSDVSDYSADNILNILKKSGAINNNGESIDLSSLGAGEAYRFDNMVLVKYTLSDSAYFSAYDAGSIDVNGEKWTIYAAAGPYLLFCTDGNPNQALVQAVENITGFPYNVKG